MASLPIIPIESNDKLDVKIVVNSLFFNHCLQNCMHLNLELGLDTSGITPYNRAGNPIPGKKFPATPRR